MTTTSGQPTAPPAATPPAPASPPAAPPAPATPATGSDGGSLAQRVDTIEGKLDTIINTLHGKAADHTAARLDRGSEIEEIARREIERGQAEQQRQAQEQAAAGDLAALKADVAKLRETPPAPPIRKLTKLMWPGAQ